MRQCGHQKRLKKLQDILENLQREDNKKYLELPAALKYEIETSGITKKELQ